MLEPKPRDTGWPARLGLGCARVGSFNNPQSLAESQALIVAALDMGVSVIDTSNIYGQGDSEAVIGRALAGRRDDAFVVTKGGRDFSAKMRLLRPFKPLLRPLLAARRKPAGAAPAPSAVTARRAEEMRHDWQPRSLAAGLDASLARLRTDHVDGFLLHSPPAGVAGDPAVGEALAALRAAGKARFVGISCDDLATLDAALGQPMVDLLQLPWDVVVAAHRGGQADTIRARGIVVMAREVIRLQPGIAPLEAVRVAVDDPIVTTALIGTTSLAHLSATAAAILPQGREQELAR